MLTLLENKNATVAQNAGFILANCSSEIDQIASQIADCGVQQLSSLTRLLTGIGLKGKRVKINGNPQ